MNQDTLHTGRQIVLAVFSRDKSAQRALEMLIEQDFSLDRVSILGKASTSGDDPIGVYYQTAGDRMRAWGGMGAFWGGLFGLFAGAAGMFLLPGLGMVVAMGPVAEALVGAAVGAGIGGGVMAGGAAMTQISQAVHQLGVPEDKLDDVHRLVQEGNCVLMLIVDQEEVEPWSEPLRKAGADPLWRFPYAGLTDLIFDRDVD